MSEYLMNCCHCGKQNLMLDGDGLDTPCEFCSKPVGKKEEKMVGKIETEMLHPETLEKTVQNNATAPPMLAPMPPRPVTEGLNRLNRNMAMYHYYEANRAAITSDWQAEGQPVQLKRWGIQQSGLNGLLRRWGLREKPTKAPIAAESPHRKYSKKRKPANTQIPPSIPPTRTISATTAKVDIKQKNDAVDQPARVDIKVPQFPSFPAFSECKTELVQLRWFDTYRELAGMNIKYSIAILCAKRKAT